MATIRIDKYLFYVVDIELIEQFYIQYSQRAINILENNPKIYIVCEEKKKQIYCKLISYSIYKYKNVPSRILISIKKIRTIEFNN